ncbi:hypothetical protein F0562_007848 [Nyssa sinensis]|uniref:Uncharacterized protein n=1 Tax=Nyssa sinensis TaxID=561372 RepID=A0A5J5A871_9ASTE|nr:hypothetical protein F0562_007848 [Nyssa sinensis]
MDKPINSAALMNAFDSANVKKSGAVKRSVSLRQFMRSSGLIQKFRRSEWKQHNSESQYSRPVWDQEPTIEDS